MLTASNLSKADIQRTANRVARRFTSATNPLPGNMVRVYVEAELMLLSDKAGANVAMYVARRNHAERTLLGPRCGLSRSHIVRIRNYAGISAA